MFKFKIFFGTFNGPNAVSADIKINEWLKNHPHIELIEMKYQQSRFGDHSICIAYEEVLK